MAAHGRQIKQITLTLGVLSFECQVSSWTYDPGIPDGERFYTQCPDGVIVDEGIPEPTLQLSFFSDWRSDGISDFLSAHTGEDAEVELNHHPDIPAEHVVWTGLVRLKAPPVGGESRVIERTEVTLVCVGPLAYARGV